MKVFENASADNAVSATARAAGDENQMEPTAAASTTKLPDAAVRRKRAPMANTSASAADATLAKKPRGIKVKNAIAPTTTPTTSVLAAIADNPTMHRWMTQTSGAATAAAPTAPLDGNAPRRVPTAPASLAA
jgi:hypothetical protein